MISILYNLKIESDFLIGTGTGSISSDDQTVTDNNGNLIIPGSTIKGLLRWEAAALCDYLGIYTCDGRMGEEYHLCGIHDDKLCPLCAIFGSVRHQSAFHFSSAEPTGESKLSRRAFNAINPETGAVKDTGLFFYDMARGGSFNGSIEQFYSLPEPILKDGNGIQLLETLLKTSLGMVRAIGRGKSRGHGACKFEIESWPTSDQIKEVKSWRF